MRGYITKLNIFFKDQSYTYKTNIVKANHILYETISGPLDVFGSCLRNINNRTHTKWWFTFIEREENCPMKDAFTKAYEYGSDIILYRDTEWSNELYSMHGRNIIVNSDTYYSIKEDNYFGIEIYKNKQWFFIFSGSVVLILFIGFMMYKLGYVIRNYKEYIRNYKNYISQRKTLKLIKYDKIEITSCTICLEDIKNKDQVISLRCKHVFHKECIYTWIKKKPICPNCNQLIHDKIETTPLILL